jgi:RHS repeat-associated protein
MNQDTVANLYDFPAREYGTQGRWPSPDPAGISSVQPNDPQTWNRYAYVRNTPLSHVDPTGMEDCNPEDSDVSACCDPTVDDCSSGGGGPGEPGDPGPGETPIPDNPIDNTCTPGDFSCNPFADNSCANPFSGTCSSPFGGPGPTGWGNGNIDDGDLCVFAEFDSNGNFTGNYSVNVSISKSQCAAQGGQWTPTNNFYFDSNGNVQFSWGACVLQDGARGAVIGGLFMGAVGFTAGAGLGAVAGPPGSALGSGSLGLTFLIDGALGGAVTGLIGGMIFCH